MMYRSYVLIFFMAICLSALSQLLLKLSANKTYHKVIEEYLNKYVIIGYFLLGLSSVFTTIAYRKIPLSYSPIFNGLGYIIIGVLSCIILKEKITIKKILGYILIILGVVICSFR